jgi:hypothetical protein
MDIAGLFPPAGRRKRKKSCIVITSVKFSDIKNRPSITDERVKELLELKDDEIDLSDIPEITGEDWLEARPLH